MSIERNKEVKTRKPHRCTFCGWPIPVGETADYSTTVFDGEFYALYAHLECSAAFTAELEASGYCEYMTGDYDPPQRIRELFVTQGRGQ